ncbi:MAG: hypothetical protein ACYSU0_04280 [Planctomycetota bacterium]|jgi:hypothetical protein
MTSTDRLRRKELERLAARLEKVADSASRDFTSLFFSRRKGRATVPRAEEAEGSAARPRTRTRKGGAR